jgi:hypothetical protein
LGSIRKSARIPPHPLRAATPARNEIRKKGEICHVARRSSFFQAAAEIPSLGGWAAQHTIPFFAIPAQICTSPKSLPLSSPRITHTKNSYLLKIGFVPQKPAST